MGNYAIVTKIRGHAGAVIDASRVSEAVLEIDGELGGGCNGALFGKRVADDCANQRFGVLRRNKVYLSN